MAVVEEAALLEQTMVPLGQPNRVYPKAKGSLSFPPFSSLLKDNDLYIF